MYQHGEKHRSLEILLVEDNPGDVRLTLEAFRDTGSSAHVSVVRDGVEALEFLERHDRFHNAPRPDLILLDLNLPRKNGRELLVELKSQPELRRIPVMILSTSAAESDVSFSYENYANCYIRKPIAFDSYFEVVRSIERFWGGVASLPARSGRRAEAGRA